MLGRLLKDLLLGRWRAPASRSQGPPPREPVLARYRLEVFDVPDESAARPHHSHARRRDADGNAVGT